MEQDTESTAAVLRDLIGSKQKKQLKKDGDNSHDRLFDKVSSKGYYLPQRNKTRRRPYTAPLYIIITI